LPEPQSRAATADPSRIPEDDIFAWLVTVEIGRIVVEAAYENVPVSVPAITDAVLKTYPSCGVPRNDIAIEVLAVAMRAGIMVESGPRDRRHARPTSRSAGALRTAGRRVPVLYREPDTGAAARD
jgi:hypothetical protein